MGFEFPVQFSAFGRLLATRANAAATRLLLQLGDMAIQSANNLGAITVNGPQSTSTTTGAIIVPGTGGVGVGGALNVGGDISGSRGVLADLLVYSNSNFHGKSLPIGRIHERINGGINYFDFTVSGTPSDPESCISGSYRLFTLIPANQTVTFTVDWTARLPLGWRFGEGVLVFCFTAGRGPNVLTIETFSLVGESDQWTTIHTQGFSSGRIITVPIPANIERLKQIRWTMTAGNLSTLFKSIEYFPADPLTTENPREIASQFDAAQQIWGPSLSLNNKAGHITELRPGRMRATNLPEYASDAAAASDAGLLPGEYYLTTGNTLLRAKR